MRYVTAWLLYWLGDWFYKVNDWLDRPDVDDVARTWGEWEAWYRSTLWGRILWDTRWFGTGRAYQFLMNLAAEVQGDGPGPWKKWKPSDDF